MRSINCFRKHMSWAFVRAVFLTFVFVLPIPILVTASPSQAGVSWDYRLLGKLNSAQNQEGMTIVITGSGSFDLSQQTINGGGGYTILDSGGNVVGRGTWNAAQFISFDPMAPGRSPGEGGRLELEASFDGTGTGVLNDPSVPVVIQCSMWGEEEVGPPGYPWPPDFVEVGPYTTHKTGAVMFNLNQ